MGNAELAALMLQEENPSRACLKEFLKAGDRAKDLIMQILTFTHRPDMPVIMCTGYSERISEQEARDMGIRAFALKPIDIQDLSRLIQKALD